LSAIVYLPKSPVMPGIKVGGTRGGIPAPMNPGVGGMIVEPLGKSVGWGVRASG
jgi:hypothetical protein